MRKPPVEKPSHAARANPGINKRSGTACAPIGVARVLIALAERHPQVLAQTLAEEFVHH